MKLDQGRKKDSESLFQSLKFCDILKLRVLYKEIEQKLSAKKT